jgi:ABC-type oligopeptide transport system substrate-binding subunit
MDLSDGRKTERVRERQVQEHGIKSLTAQKRESLSQGFRTGNLELLDAPFRKKILRELSVDVIVFDEERFDHLTSSLSREPLNSPPVRGANRLSLDQAWFSERLIIAKRQKRIKQMR